MAIAGSTDGIVRLFNLIDGELTEQITQHRAPVTQVALSHSYLFSLSGSRDTTVKVYDNEMGEIVAEFNVNHRSFLSFEPNASLQEHSAPISHARILEDNRKILSSDEQNYIKTWWANTGELIDSVGLWESAILQFNLVSLSTTSRVKCSASRPMENTSSRATATTCEFVFSSFPIDRSV